MSGRVQWETPDYAYTPQGRMADDWGKTGPRTEVAGYIRAFRLRTRRTMDNDQSRDSIEYIWSLDDETVLASAHYGSDEHREVIHHLGGDDRYINPSWVSSNCATDAYERGLIDEHEFDRLAED